MAMHEGKDPTIDCGDALVVPDGPLLAPAARLTNSLGVKASIMRVGGVEASRGTRPGFFGRVARRSVEMVSQ